MKLCFVHIFRIEERNHLEFLGNIPIRTSEVLDERAEIHFLYNGQIETDFFKKKGIRLHKYGIAKNGIIDKLANPFLAVSSIRRVCRKENIDLVLNLSDHYYLFLIWIGARLAGSRCMARVVGILPQSKSLPLRRRIKKQLGRALERLSLLLADHVLCLSYSLKNQLVQRGNDASKISVISQGVNLDLFKSRELSDVKKKPRRLLFVGRIVKNKGVEECIKAFLKVKQTYPDLELVLCGHGVDKDMLTKRYRAFKDIIFKGFVPREKLPEFYYSSDIFLLPSYSEGMPNAVLEAMASKLPVIASSTGDIPLLLGEGRGIPIAAGDVDGFAAAIKTMISDDELRLSCVHKAYDYVLRYHSYGAVREATLELFNSIIRRSELKNY